MSEEITVSICCTAYNHEKYIAEALESFISQQTDFKYEIIVHDDASTDRTPDIIRGYVKKYPDLIFPIYQTRNQYSQGKNILAEYMVPHTRGTYVALCEGDDYWTDPQKLKKQVSALRAHPECFFCVHSTQEVQENGTPTGVFFPHNRCPSRVFASRDFLSLTQNYSFHTSSYMFNGDKWREYQSAPPEFRRICPVGDEPYMLYFGQMGSVLFLNDCMSCYRRGVASSWSKLQNTGDIVTKKCSHCEAMAETIRLFDEFSNGLYHDICMKRQAYYWKTSFLLKGSIRNFRKPEFRKMLQAFPLKHKCMLYMAMLFPRLSRKIYIQRLVQANRRNGY